MSDPADKRSPPASRALRLPVATAKKLARVIPDAVERFFADQCPQQAVGIAHRVLFSIAPLAIVLVSIFRQMKRLTVPKGGASRCSDKTR